MTRWSLFLGGVALLTLLTVAFAVLTSRSIRDRREAVAPERWGDPAAVLDVSRRSLYLNAAASQGLLLVGLLALAAVAGVGLSAHGLPGDLSIGWAVLVGIGFGIALAGLNLGMQRTLDALDIDYDDSLRELLAPSTPVEWALLLLVVLPIVAGFEELLFRGALIGAVEVASGASPWVLAVGSSVLFAAGHGLQGRGGLIAAGVLGLALAGGFVLTGSLVVVIVAHYVVNAVEFGVNA